MIYQPRNRLTINLGREAHLLASQFSQIYQHFEVKEQLTPIHRTWLLDEKMINLGLTPRSYSFDPA